MTPWLHIIIHTYGSWLPGDPRGHRTRHHRDHVEGDYKCPPPDTAERRAHHNHARKLMKRDPVILTIPQRERIARELRASLERHGCEVHTLCVDATHAHILARLPSPKPTDPNPWASSHQAPNSPRYPFSAHIRHIVGIAKKDASRALSNEGLAPPGGLWSKRGLAKPIQDASHLIATIAYIEAHASEGAVISPRI